MCLRTRPTGVGTRRRRRLRRSGGVHGAAAGAEGTHGPELWSAGPPSGHEHLDAAPERQATERRERETRAAAASPDPDRGPSAESPLPQASEAIGRLQRASLKGRVRLSDCASHLRYAAGWMAPSPTAGRTTARTAASASSNSKARSCPDNHVRSQQSGLKTLGPAATGLDDVGTRLGPVDDEPAGRNIADSGSLHKICNGGT